MKGWVLGCATGPKNTQGGERHRSHVIKHTPRHRDLSCSAVKDEQESTLDRKDHGETLTPRGTVSSQGRHPGTQFCRLASSHLVVCGRHALLNRRQRQLQILHPRQ